MGKSPIISHLISSPLDAAGSISWTGEKIFPSPIESGLFVGILSEFENPHALLPLPTSEAFISNLTNPFEPTWNCCSKLPKKQKSNGRAWGESQASSIFVFTEFDKPWNGNGGTNAISLTSYKSVSPISKKSAFSCTSSGHSNEKSSPALT